MSRSKTSQFLALSLLVGGLVPLTGTAADLPGKGRPYVQEAASGTLECSESPSCTLTLKKVRTTVTALTERHEVSISNEQFYASWDRAFSGKSTVSAMLVYRQPGGARPLHRVLNLTDPVYNAAKQMVTYRATRVHETRENHNIPGIAEPIPTHRKFTGPTLLLESDHTITPPMNPSPQLCVPPDGYSIGDTGPSGGLIFFVDNQCAYSDFDYLEAAPAKIESKSWGCEGKTVRWTKSWIGQGHANTTAMIRADCGNAAEAANGYVSPDLTDGWFLPSRGELNLINERVATDDRGNYWSSTEFDANSAWWQVFSGDLTLYTSKDQLFNVWPVRAFPCSMKLQYFTGATGPGGGVIFFVDRNCEYPDFDYLEVAPGSVSGGDLRYEWGCSGTEIGLTRPWIGTGQANTTEMINAGCGNAAQAADAYVSPNGTDDWFLPSKDEVALMRERLANKGLVDGNYWTSTEQGATHALATVFTRLRKDITLSVLPIRAF